LIKIEIGQTSKMAKTIPTTSTSGKRAKALAGQSSGDSTDPVSPKRSPREFKSIKKTLEAIGMAGKKKKAGGRVTSSAGKKALAATKKATK